MTAAAISQLYSKYKQFTVSRVKSWKPKIHANLKQMIRNATDEPTLEAAIKNLDVNMLEPSGIAVTIQNIYKDAASVWGGRIYQVVKQQGDKYTRQAMQRQKRLMPIGYNEDIVNEIIAYFRVNLLNEAVLPITDTMKAWILEKVIEAQKEGRSIQQVAQSMLIDDFPARRAEVIARTETIKAANFGAVQGAKKTGLKTEKVWIAARDFRTRRIPRDEFSHAAMHGKTAAMDEPFYVPNRNGGVDDLMQPGDPKTGEAANIIQCRCTVGFNVLRGADGMPVREGAKPPLHIPPPEPIQRQPPKPVFKPAATVEEAKQWAMNNLGIKKHTSDLSVDALNTIHKRLFELKSIYKSDRLKFIERQDTAALASANGYEMSFSKEFDNPEKLMKYISKEVESGWLNKGINSVEALIDHEFGHVLTVDPLRSGYDLAKELSKLKGEYTRAMTKLKKEGKDPKLSAEFISTYGQKDIFEFTAEGFSMALNSKNPSPFAIRIKALIDQYYKK